MCFKSTALLSLSSSSPAVLCCGVCCCCRHHRHRRAVSGMLKTRTIRIIYLLSASNHPVENINIGILLSFCCCCKHRANAVRMWPSSARLSIHVFMWSSVSLYERHMCRSIAHPPLFEVQCMFARTTIQNTRTQTHSHPQRTSEKGKERKEERDGERESERESMLDSR